MNTAVRNTLKWLHAAPFSSRFRSLARAENRSTGRISRASFHLQICGALLLCAPTIGRCETGASSFSPNLLVDLARLGSAGLAALFIYLAYKLLRDNKNATLFLIVSSLFCVATLGVELIHYIFPNQVGLFVFPSHFRSSIPPPIVMENHAPKTLTSGQGVLTCQPNASVSVDIGDLVNALEQSELLVLRTAAPNINHPNSEFGPDADAGSKP